MLYFSPVENFGTSNPYIEMNYSGFDLPIEESNRHLLRFNIKTFFTLTSKKKEVVQEDSESVICGRATVATGPDVAYSIVNNFLEMLSIEEQKKIAFVFLIAHMEIQSGQPDASDIEVIEDKIAKLFDTLDKDIDICKKTEDFVFDAKIPLADMSEAGTRPQDSVNMTFHEDEAVLIIAITIFMKLISPIIGAFIYKYASVIDNVHKEAHARTMLTPLHSRKYKTLLIKLKRYITKLVEQKLSVDATSMFNGQTLQVAASHALDVAIIKRLVCVDLNRKEGNIIKYLASCGRGSTESSQKNINSTKGARIIMDPQDQEKDEGNTSRMEVESNQSSKTADTPIILKVAANKHWQDLANEYQLDPELVESTRAFYRRNPIVINVISQYVLCMYFGPVLGGGNSVMHLSASSISDLSAVLQILLMKEGIVNLSHALSFKVVEATRIPQQYDYVFVNGWTGTHEYSECKKNLPAGFGCKEWNGRLKEIATFLIQRTVIYNTAPSVWDLSGADVKNDKPFTDFQPLMVELMKFINLIYTRGKAE